MIERIPWTRPPATSIERTPITRSSGSRATAPGWPLTSTSLEPRPHLSGLPAQSGQEARDALAAADRRGRGGRLAAAVSDRDGVLGEQLDEPVRVAVLDRCEEAPRELVPLLARGLEARPPLLDVPPGAYRELAAVLFPLADDRRDLAVSVAEHLVQQEDGTLDRREALEQDEERDRERVGELDLLRRPRRRVDEQRLRQPLADVGCSRRTRAERSTSIASRVVTAISHALGALDSSSVGAVQAQERLLHHVLGLGDAARASGRRSRDTSRRLRELVIADMTIS